jgi:hypothetical protein
MRRVLRWRREGVAWRARGIGVSGQRKGRRRVLTLVLRPLLPIIFPHGHRFLLRSVCVSLALALALAGKENGNEGGVVWGAG